MAENLVNIEDILDDIELTDMGFGKNANPYRRYQLKSMAIRGVRKMKMYSAMAVKSELIPINGDGSIDLPSDYLDYEGIYALDPDNFLVPLYKNKRINLSQEPILDSDNIPILDSDGQQLYSSGAISGSESFKVVIGDSRVNLLYRSTLASTAMYGAGGGKNKYGYYKVNYQNNTIVLDVRDDIEYIVLDYVSDSVDSRHELVIPHQLREAMYSWIMWKVIENLSSITAREKLRARTEFYNELRLATRSSFKMIMPEYKKQANTNTNQSVKF